MCAVNLSARKVHLPPSHPELHLPENHSVYSSNQRFAVPLVRDNRSHPHRQIHHYLSHQHSTLLLCTEPHDVDAGPDSVVAVPVSNAVVALGCPCHAMSTCNVGSPAGIYVSCASVPPRVFRRWQQIWDLVGSGFEYLCNGRLFRETRYRVCEESHQDESKPYAVKQCFLFEIWAAEHKAENLTELRHVELLFGIS
ncbi:hypothetical protein EX30DRAFT_232864 [Ascodesmis nigricans]|uniref:Uncharacterized protein n=1 Tax=Ascodesmis nigricans TaxID=341454 RepID=A0A4S2MYF6_9PEZI|nr:hypothetical protein EX30DRAFT_232864 [Ascodesmis nigricans]